MGKKVSKSTGGRSLLTISVRRFIDDYVYTIDLDADYQREKIWTTKDQQALLDSILNDIDIPKMYLVKVDDNEPFNYNCIDGKQRMATLLRFFKPEPGEERPLRVEHCGRQYTYEKLQNEHPTVAKLIEDYELSFTIYDDLDEERVRLIFRRLQLGIRLNSGELLKTRTGAIHDFIYKEIGKDGPFVRKTNLSEKRFSRQFTLAQICINSFAKARKDGKFDRARLQDIEDFFEAKHDLPRNDRNLVRIMSVLKRMDKAFGESASAISSRAIAVSAYLFVEGLVVSRKANLISKFAKFYVKLLGEIKQDMERLSGYAKPTNTMLMEEFQKYILQASVEGYSIKRRHDFLEKAFEYYRRRKGRIIGSE